MIRRLMMIRVGISFLVLAVANPLSAQSPHVAGYVRQYASTPPSAEAGRLLLTELNCVQCHLTDAAKAAELVGKPAPNLSRAGERIHGDWFKEYLLDPHAIKPGTTMPDVLGHLNADQRDEAAAALSALLASTGRVQVSPALTQAVENGQRLFHTVGCAICHQPIEGETAALATSTPLPDLATKYTVPSLTQFLADPLTVRAGGRMPHLGLSPDEARSIASYLLREIDVPANLTYRYYEGNWSKLPDFAELEPVAEGQAVSFDLDVARRQDQFGLVFDSYVVVPRDGDYTFYVGSDDGSRILLGKFGKIAESDGIHPLQFGSGKVRLEAGTYPVQIQYFEGGGGEELKVEWEGPDLPRQQLSPFLVSDPEAVAPQPQDEVQSTQQLVKAGAEWYQRLNCQQCHQLDAIDSVPSRSAEEFEIAKLSGGCLTGAEPAPQYQLSEHQQTSLKLALAELPTAGASPVTGTDRVQHTLVQFNCIACHQRGDLGGVEPGRNSLFVSTQPEMGDEGRLPPPLDGVGSKLAPEWFANLLDRGANDRFYMLARMPGFGIDNVHHLISDLQELDPLGDVADVETNEPERRIKVAGHFLAGDQSLGCIKCHVFADYKATGIQAISLTTMPTRLNQAWFQKYMLDPNALRPGTRMPASFPKGKTYYKDLLDGTAETQIYALWKFLEDGDQANPPDGLTQAGIELVADEYPRIYRNFISDAGSRAIAVGYPERVNLAFDANRLRLALLWQGRFIDASMHWTGRGQGFQQPLGVNRLTFSDASDWAQLAESDQAWPASTDSEPSHRFRGYRLNPQRQPTFLYDVFGVEVQDQPIPIQANDFPGLKRQFEMRSATPQTLTFRAAVSSKIEAGPDNTFVTADGLQLRIEGDAETFLHSQGSEQELRVQVKPASDPLRWSIVYQW